MPFGADIYWCPRRDLSAIRRAEERRLLEKGLLPGSNKWHEVLGRRMRRYGGGYD